MSVVFSFDAETNGLWGDAFSIGAVVYVNGKEVTTFVARCKIVGEIDLYVSENVLPEMKDIPITHNDYTAMLKDFMRFYLDNKEDVDDVIVHMGMPVEAKLFLDAHELNIIGDFDAPYPLIDISGNLQQEGFNSTSVDSFNKMHDVQIEGNSHNPLYDSRAAAECYKILMEDYKEK